MGLTFQCKTRYLCHSKGPNPIKVAQYSFKKMEHSRFRCVFVDNYYLQKVPYLYKTTSKEFEFLYKSYATAVTMATMTFQDGVYFSFKVI
jgi:hypothetical protein